MRGHIRKFMRSEVGAVAVEYGLILALVVLAAMGAVMLTAQKTINMWNNVSTEVTRV